ncbi:aminomethyl transferase family protein [Dehalobacter sp. TBBPA1]|uniref:aminomethyl transferase family protein n=1 Tax=Dehalobacter sp. TBBPA1 TaxID=3235037 RepID=UPI0034A4AD2D
MIKEDSANMIEKSFDHHPLIPYDPSVMIYISAGDVVLPYEYTNWMDEVESWKDGAYISHSLNPQPTWRIKGPDAIKYLSSVLVNNFEKFPIGTAKHAIMCNEKGLNMGDGVMLRLDEDEFLFYEMGALYIAHVFEQGNWNAVGEDLTGTKFMYQIAGPRSLEIIEAAAGKDLHDIRFLHHRKSSIAGVEVNVIRVGMAGSLAYELHGDAQYGRVVYNRVLEAGKPLGLKRIGFRSYLMNHTEDGFPQFVIHFTHPWIVEDENFVAKLKKRGDVIRCNTVCRGSMGPDIRLRFCNPVELGWANRISFNHDFVGRAALEKEVANPRRKMVTLVWNAEDILDIYASKFKPGEPYANIDTPIHNLYDGNGMTLFADQVLKNGKLIGISSGRLYSYHFRQMLSLCTIDVEHSDIGNEVIVLWGDPGTKQKEIRATVSRFPYFNENRNENIDVNTIPRLAKYK